jgi:hypothetical protein
MKLREGVRSSCSCRLTSFGGRNDVGCICILGFCRRFLAAEYSWSWKFGKRGLCNNQSHISKIENEMLQQENETRNNKFEILLGKDQAGISRV